MIDNYKNKVEIIVKVKDENNKIIKQINGIQDKRKRRSIHVNENKNTNILFNGGKIIRNCISYFE